jgi:hypothetical protein
VKRYTELPEIGQYSTIQGTITYKSEQFDTTITAMLNYKFFTRLEQNTIRHNHI